MNMTKVDSDIAWFADLSRTSYLAYRLAKNLKKRQPELGITDEDLLCVSIAGLCHDLGKIVNVYVQLNKL